MRSITQVARTYTATSTMSDHGHLVKREIH